MKSKPSIFAIVGPTATGKTAVGVALAQKLQTEVISVDSQLVYQELHIGVAKPTVAEQGGVPHHLIDVVSPTSTFSAGDYAKLARPILENLLAMGKPPVIVGGTGFYLKALLAPSHLPPVPINPAIRKQLQQDLDEQGSLALYQRLQNQQADRAAQLHPNDVPRIIRALEIIETTGQPVPQTNDHWTENICAIGLTYADRHLHLQKIEERLDAMLDAGFLDEVETLYQRYGFCAAMQKAHGYPELIDVLEGKRSLEDAKTQIIINIRQYSKRQMTWFRKMPNVSWFAVDEV